jgi:hypothetical protein
MGKKKLLKIISTTIFLTVVILSMVEIRTQYTRRLWDKYILDNRNHNLSCDELPKVEDINQVVNQNREVIENIIIEMGKNYSSEEVIPFWENNSVQDGENFNVSISWGEMSPGCENSGKGDILFTYPSSKDREIIEKYIDGDTFIGIPYRLKNV